MKRTITMRTFLSVALIALLGFSSCGKYEDGPGFSLRTKTARLTGEWEIQKVAGEPVLEVFGDLTWEFDKDGDFIMTMSSAGVSFSMDGDWEWADDKEAIEITMDGEKDKFDIKRLTNSEFWFEDEDSDLYELEKI